MRYLPNGQWTLEKSAAEQVQPQKPSIDGLMGKNHTVEVHPDMDHLYNVKGMIQQSGRPYLHIGDLKRTGNLGHIVNKVPRDARGRVTPEMIDQHIAKLPKQKVQIHVKPYTIQAQQHRDDAGQYVASVGLHPDTLNSMNPQHRHIWDTVKNFQHDLDGHGDQVGWVRIDPHKYTQNGYEPNDGHWHYDEIQSDFGTPEKMNAFVRMYSDADNIKNELDNARHPEAPELNELWDDYLAADTRHHNGEISGREFQTVQRHLDNAIDSSAKRIAEQRKKKAVDADQAMYKLFSHGHEDPQHLVHSAVNQLARQHGITSTSMDTLKDQAHQSGLQHRETNYYDPILNHPTTQWAHELMDWQQENPMSQEESDQLWEQHAKPLIQDHTYDISFKRAMDKLGPEGMRQWAHLPTQDNSSWMFGDNGAWEENLEDGELYGKVLSPETRQKLLGLDDQERSAMSRYLSDLRDKYIDPITSKKAGLELPPEFPNHWEAYRRDRDAFDQQRDQRDDQQRINREKTIAREVPVHVLNTYGKRPVRLGMQRVPKADVLGDDPNDRYDQVQFGRLYKKLNDLRELLSKIDD